MRDWRTVCICGLTTSGRVYDLQIEDVKDAYIYWPQWINTTRMPGMLTPTQVRCQHGPQPFRS